MADAKKGQIVNRTGLSDVFGVALTTIDSWVRQDCPVVVRGRGKGQEWQFNTAHIAKWLQDKAVDDASGEVVDDINLLKIRKAKAETELAELELAEKKGEVALIAEFERAQSIVFGTIRSNMMNIPQRAVLQLLGETDARVFKEKLKAEIVLALESAADAEFEDDDDV